MIIDLQFLKNSDWKSRWLCQLVGYSMAETPEVGGQGGHVPPQVLGYQLTLFGPRGADYVRHITTCPPIFSEDAASLNGNNILSGFRNEVTKLGPIQIKVSQHHICSME